MAESFWKVGWRRNGNGSKSIEWGVPYEGTASGRELSFGELVGKVEQLAEDNDTRWSDGRIMVWRIEEYSEPVRANEVPELFDWFHQRTTRREYSSKWHHPNAYLG
jgi:hypothetical protein